MNILEVNNKKNIKEFLDFPNRLYKNDPNWIPHLRQDIEKVFDKKTNKYFRHGEAIRWILKDNENKTIGRIAAFINQKTSKGFKQPTGGIGFFECINNQEAAFCMFDTAKKWLEDRGMEAMDGPINFGEKDKYWGLVTQNFTASPYYCQNYNPEYYVPFFENYGFKVYYEQYIYSRNTTDELAEVLIDKANRIAKNPAYTFKTIDKSDLYKYAEDFRIIYNRAWVKHEAFKSMEHKQAMTIMKTIKPILDEDLIHFAYYNDVPVGFFIALPEINQIFKRIGDNFNWWGKLKFVVYQKLGVMDTFFGLAFGIDPAHQGKGLEGALFNSIKKQVAIKNKYKDVVITWIGDFNPKMIHVIENLGAEKLRTLCTYRYLFDREKPFERTKAIT